MNLSDVATIILSKVIRQLDLVDQINIERVSNQFKDGRQDYWLSKTKLTENDLRELFKHKKYLSTAHQLSILLSVVDNMPNLTSICVTAIPQDVREKFFKQLASRDTKIVHFNWSPDKLGLIAPLLPSNRNNWHLFKYFIDFDDYLKDIPFNYHLTRIMYYHQYLNSWLGDQNERFGVFYELTNLYRNIYQIERTFGETLIDKYVEDKFDYVRKSIFACLELDDRQVPFFKEMKTSYPNYSYLRNRKFIDLDLSAITSLNLTLVFRTNDESDKLLSRLMNLQEVVLDTSSELNPRTLDMLGNLPYLSSLSLAGYFKNPGVKQALERFLSLKSKSMTHLIIESCDDQALLEYAINLEWPKIKTFFMPRIIYSNYVLIFSSSGSHRKWSGLPIGRIFSCFNRFRFLDFQFEGDFWIPEFQDFAAPRLNRMFYVRSIDQINVGHNYIISDNTEWPVHQVLPFF